MSTFSPLFKFLFLASTSVFIACAPLQAATSPTSTTPGEVDFGTIPYMPAPSTTYNYYSDGSYVDEPYSLDYDNFYSAPYYDNYGGFYWGGDWHDRGWNHHDWWHQHDRNNYHNFHDHHDSHHDHSGGHHAHTGGGHHGGGGHHK